MIMSFLRNSTTTLRIHVQRFGLEYDNPRVQQSGSNADLLELDHLLWWVYRWS